MGEQKLMQQIWFKGGKKKFREVHNERMKKLREKIKAFSCQKSDGKSHGKSDGKSWIFCRKRQNIDRKKIEEKSDGKKSGEEKRDGKKSDEEKRSGRFFQDVVREFLKYSTWSECRGEEELSWIPKDWLEANEKWLKENPGLMENPDDKTACDNKTACDKLCNRLGTVIYRGPLMFAICQEKNVMLRNLDYLHAEMDTQIAAAQGTETKLLSLFVSLLIACFNALFQYMYRRV